MSIKEKLYNYDIELSNIIKKENLRQEQNIELIASENYASKLVMQLQGSQLTNKYAEGYPGIRYYEGCKYIDYIENLAINRAKKLFNANYVNVQPHSGSQANFAVYNALLKPGDTILGMDLSHGGHLTHGSPVNLSGKLYNVISYKTNKNGEIDYKNLFKLAKKNKPKMIIGGFSSYSGLCNWKKMKEIALINESWFLVDMSHIAGLVAAGIYPNPIPYADIVTTTTHKTLGGPRGGMILSKNKNRKFHKKIDSSVFPGTQGGPLMHIIAAKALSFKEALDPKFIIYQKQVVKNAKEMVKIFSERKYQIVSGNTYNHLFLINLSNKNITGKKASSVLENANIIVNKNTIPNDLNKYSVTSGIRIGTPAVTRRGLKEKEVQKISHWISDILDNINNINLIQKIKKEVIKLCKKYPVY